MTARVPYLAGLARRVAGPETGTAGSGGDRGPDRTAPSLRPAPPLFADPALPLDGLLELRGTEGRYPDPLADDPAEQADLGSWPVTPGEPRPPVARTGSVPWSSSQAEPLAMPGISVPPATGFPAPEAAWPAADTGAPADLFAAGPGHFGTGTAPRAAGPSPRAPDHGPRAATPGLPAAPVGAPGRGIGAAPTPAAGSRSPTIPARDTTTGAAAAPPATATAPAAATVLVSSRAAGLSAAGEAVLVPASPPAGPADSVPAGSWPAGHATTGPGGASPGGISPEVTGARMAGAGLSGPGRSRRGAPGRVTIGTIEVTVVPPARPAHEAGGRHVASGSRPSVPRAERRSPTSGLAGEHSIPLRDGLRRWYGIAQG